MVLSEETFLRLYECFLLRRADQAVALVADITPADMAAWLQGRIGSPAAERHLLELFFGEGGVTSSGAKAYGRFYRELTLRRRPQLRRRIIEGGEISQVSELVGMASTSWRNPETKAPMPVVYKRMPRFLHRADAEKYVERYFEYNAVLRDRVGIRVPHFDARIVGPSLGPVVIYVIQARLDPASLGHEILKSIGKKSAERLYGMILREYEKLFRFNQDSAVDGYELGLDGQIPNWAVLGYSGDAGDLTGTERLVYLDTNVPMIRIDGQDVVATDMYFQDLPGAARWLIKRLNLDQDVMDRYFQMRVIILDFLSNTLVRHRGDLVPRFIEMSNAALADTFAAGAFAPYTLREVQAYYRSDVALWRLWRSLKLLGTLSDSLTSGDWRSLKRVGDFYHIWTQPIY